MGIGSLVSQFGAYLGGHSTTTLPLTAAIFVISIACASTHDLSGAAADGGGQRRIDRAGGGGRVGDVVRRAASEARTAYAQRVIAREGGDPVSRGFSVDDGLRLDTVALAGDDGRERPERVPHSPISFSHSSSVSTATPCFLASASFEPAPGPATT